MKEYKSVMKAVVCGLIATMYGCADLTNEPIQDIHLIEGKTHTSLRATAGQTLHLRFDAMGEEPIQVVQLRMWSLGQLAGIDVQVSDPNGKVIWSGSSAGTECITPALRLTKAGQYTATVRWMQGKGLAGYRYEHLYDGTSPITGRQQIPLSHGRFGHRITSLEDGGVLITGGDDAASPRGHQHIVATDSAEVMATETGKATATEPMLTPRAFHTATRIIAPGSPQDGHVLVAGGMNNSGAIRDTELYNPETGAYVAGPKLPGARVFQSALAISGTGSFLDGTVMLVGGEYTRPGPQHDLLEGLYKEVDENPTNLASDAIKKAERSSMWYFRPGDDSIKRVGQELAYGRIVPTLTLLADGRILILGGGIDSLPSSPGCSSGELGCRCSKTVPLCTQFQCPESECVANQYINFVRKDVATDLVEVYDTATGMLTKHPARMKKARVGHTATVLPDGKLLIAGGATAHRRNFQADEGGLFEFPRTLDSVEIFDPVLDTFRLLKPLAVPSEGHGTVVRPQACQSSGAPCVLLAGGYRGVPGGLSNVSAVSFFDRLSEEFWVRDTLNQARVGAQVAPLNSKQAVLVIGGTSPQGILAETPSAEMLQWGEPRSQTP